MTIDETLVLASASWRGIPLFPIGKTLGEVGERFNTAFAEAPFSAIEGGREYAFEYFTGLLFNGEYRNLEGLTELVASWLESWAGGVRASERFVLFWAVAPHETTLLRGTGDPTRFPVYYSPEVSVYFPHGHWELYSPARTGIPEKWLAIFVQPGLGMSVYFAYFWNEHGPNGIYKRGREDGSYYNGETVQIAVEPVELTVFKSAVLEAITAYRSAISGLLRPPVGIMDTSRADNPNIFPAWAEERYGAPVAR